MIVVLMHLWGTWATRSTIHQRAIGNTTTANAIIHKRSRAIAYRANVLKYEGWSNVNRESTLPHIGFHWRGDVCTARSNCRKR